MRIRRGFVSNSSSSSFILISKESLPEAKDIKKTSPDEEIMNGKYWKRKLIDASIPGEYNRNNIKKITKIEDKIIYLVHLYALRYSEEKPCETYFNKMGHMRQKLEYLGERRGYLWNIMYPSLKGGIDRDGEVYTYIDVSTECEYIPQVVELMEREDTTDLESFIFNLHSFAILGGDEYEETFQLAYDAKREVLKEGYPYFRIAEYPDIEKGTWKAFPDYEYHWGEWNPSANKEEE